MPYPDDVVPIYQSVMECINPILMADGIPDKVMLLATDLTERRHKALALRLTKERAEQATEAMSSFLSNMSHEIRTPMGAFFARKSAGGHARTGRFSVKLTGLLLDLPGQFCQHFKRLYGNQALPTRTVILK
ncbi:hypothetical protein [Halopseudomonas salegens]|uniref:hypothetical protein n=1 Tax=Halopseudomonas salegens TaxID=1434072 RepID=UPI0012FDA7F5|nr:hypothetical protein [Halopseudomonas salegens]